jgi:amidase
MDRSEFIRSFIFSPAIFQGLAEGSFQERHDNGILRLSSDHNFTSWLPVMVPACHVNTGDIVLIEMSHGLPGLVTREGRFREPGPGDRVNPQTGPVFVDGIMAGDALAIDILDIKTADWGYCSGRIFELRDGYAIFSPTLRLPLQPMIGGIGVAPSEGSADTSAPTDTGGNMDCTEVRAGSTIVFTARVNGALVGMGDSHALQGDGEITGQGIETDATALVRFRKLAGTLSDRPVIMRSDSISTIGAHKNLEDAAWQATDDMITLLRHKTGRTEQEARLLVGLTGQLKINQIVDPNKGARMEVPAWVFGI